MIEESLDRRGKNEDEQKAIRRRANAWRARTIVFSIVASTIVALFIGYANDNDQRDRSVKNCELTQADRLDRVDTLRETAGSVGQQADQILGNKRPLVYKPSKKDSGVGVLVVGKPIPPADFSTPPYKRFADFKPLIIAQAKANRATEQRNIKRAEKVLARIEKCGDVFPAPSLIPNP